MHIHHWYCENTEYTHRFEGKMQQNRAERELQAANVLYEKNRKWNVFRGEWTMWVERICAMPVRPTRNATQWRCGVNIVENRSPEMTLQSHGYEPIHNFQFNAIHFFVFFVFRSKFACFIVAVVVIVGVVVSTFFVYFYFFSLSL